MFFILSNLWLKAWCSLNIWLVLVIRGFAIYLSPLIHLVGVLWIFSALSEISEGQSELWRASPGSSIWFTVHVIHCLSSGRERGLRNRDCAVEVLTLNSAQHYSLRDLTWKCCLGQAPCLLCLTLHIPGTVAYSWLWSCCPASFSGILGSPSFPVLTWQMK